MAELAIITASYRLRLVRIGPNQCIPREGYLSLDEGKTLHGMGDINNDLIPTCFPSNYSFWIISGEIKQLSNEATTTVPIPTSQSTEPKV